MYKRITYLSKIENAFQTVPIVILIGARQVGKTSIISLRNDSGAVFENTVFIELWRIKNNSAQIQFFRTADGTEVDFIYNNLFSLKAMECKYKTFQKPARLLVLENFCEQNNITERYVINQNLNTKTDKAHFIQGFLTAKIKALL